MMIIITKDRCIKFIKYFITHTKSVDQRLSENKMLIITLSERNHNK